MMTTTNVVSDTSNTEADFHEDEAEDDHYDNKDF